MYFFDFAYFNTNIAQHSFLKINKHKLMGTPWKFLIILKSV